MIRIFASNSCFLLIGTFLLYVSPGCHFYSPNDRVDSLFTILEGVQYFYDLNRPSETHLMPNKLEEISGISYVAPNHLICVEDETGHVYHYDLKLRDLVSEWKFSGSGDYEDILYYSDSVFVLESDGDIYQFHYSEAGAKEATKYENPLSIKNDTEGLGFDPDSQSLLIACKEKRDLDGKKAEGWNIYSFELTTKSMNRDPFYSLTSKKLKTFFEEYRNFEYDEERIEVKPSAIAFNPLDNNFYILASVGKMIVVIDQRKNIKATYSIPAKLLEQPEGITFSPAGDMWISSEGVDGPGRILSFKPETR